MMDKKVPQNSIEDRLLGMEMRLQKKEQICSKNIFEFISLRNLIHDLEKILIKIEDKLTQT